MPKVIQAQTARPTQQRQAAAGNRYTAAGRPGYAHEPRVERRDRQPYPDQRIERRDNTRGREQPQTLRKAKKPIDYPLMISALILVAFGVTMVLSSSYYLAENTKSIGFDGLYYFKKQLFGALIGLGGMIGFSFFDYHLLQKFKYPLLAAAAALLAVAFIPGIGQDMNGSSRWLNIAGMSVQPSEVVKFALIVFVAATISVNRDRMNTFRYGLLPSLAVTGALCVLIYLQPNFSAIVCIFATVMVMLFTGGAKGWHMGALTVGGFMAGLGLMLTKSYRMDRVTSFLDPWQDQSDKGYQVIQSLYAIGAGGLFGRGLGSSQQKLLYLPYMQSDFIFSIIVEELGFLGAAGLIALFAFMVYRGIKVATKAPDLFGASLACGIIAIIAIQVCVNIAVVTGSIPPTGVSLPFISYGSSSLVILMCMIGILLNISRQSRA